MPKYVQYSNYLLQRRANIKLYSWKLRAYQAILNLENNVQIQFTFQETHVKPETNNQKHFVKYKIHSIPVTPSICKNRQILRVYNSCQKIPLYTKMT